MNNNIGLEVRLERIETRLEIYQLLSSYAPGVDGLDYEGLAQIWTEDGEIVSDVGTYKGDPGNAAIVQLLTNEHSVWALEEKSACHVLSLPYVHVEGDRAVATNHGRLYLREPGANAHQVYRVIVTRWELLRSELGWKVKRRINQVFAPETAATGARRLASLYKQLELPADYPLPAATKTDRPA